MVGEFNVVEQQQPQTKSIQLGGEPCLWQYALVLRVRLFSPNSKGI